MELLLKKYFGYDEFRPMQLEIINNIVAGRDTVVLMPTGGGKSLCYQIPALKFEGLTIVISPLISLMKDQVDALRANGISAEYINSTLTTKVIEEIKSRIERREVKILYIAPERLASPEFKSFLLKLEISLIAIDEAHCISEWGHDFRKDYRNLKFLKKIFIGVPIIALTATATLKVKDDILKQLNLNNPKVFISSFNRENLNLIVMRKKDTFGKILNLIDKHRNESVIIYCFSRKDTENITKQLKAQGHKALAYHAGLTNKIRRKNQELFIKDKINIMVATIAFGMGIDKPDVRLVIHHTFSKSVEGYYQEIGRAGRDGLMSDCVLFYSRGDMMKQEYFINKIIDDTLRKGVQDKLNEMMFYCERKFCRRKYILRYFGEEFEKKNCGACDVCLNLPEIEGVNAGRQRLIKKNISYDAHLFEDLKVLRGDVAQERGVPPFVVFGDVSLREMAKYFPKTEDEFMKISGVGEKKLKDFGEEFLMVINEHIRDNEIFNEVQGRVVAPVLEDDFVSRDSRRVSRGVRGKKVKRGKGGKRKKKASSKIQSWGGKGTPKNVLFEELRILRKGIAEKRGVAAFVVFPDTALKDMATKTPKNSEEFLKVKGVGDKKLKEFGADFLRVINAHGGASSSEKVVRKMKVKSRTENKVKIDKEDTTLRRFF